MGRTRQLAACISVAALAASGIAVIGTPPVGGAFVSTPFAAAADADPVIAAAGDIACGSNDSNFNGGFGTATACRQLYTSNLLVAGGYTGVLTLGDNMQSDPSPTGFATVFDPTWGRVKPIIHPEVGNHDYGYSGAKGYYGYFGAAAGDPTKGYYSFDIGAWHVVALNSNCSKIAGGCARGSPEELWLRADLAAHPGRCTLAFDHHARYSSGHDGDNLFMADLYQDLYDARADVLLSGHSHDYERFAPQDNASHLDTARGITQFVVGTGGSFFTGLGSRHPNSMASQNNTFGVLRLTLHATSFDWRFVPEAGKTWTDTGTQTCHSVTTPVNDFSIGAGPASLSVTAGQSATTTIGTTVTSGSAQTVTLSASGLPSGVSASFAPVTISAGQSSTMTIATSASTPAATSNIAVTGTGSSATHSTTVALTVNGTGPPPSTPQLVQSTGATETSAATSLVARFPAATGTAHLLVLSASVYTGTTNRITSVTDSAGNTWVRIGSYAVSGHYSDGEMWYAANARPTTTVTVRTASAAVIAASVQEFSGVAAANSLDAAVGQSNTSTAPASGPATPSGTGDLAVGFVAGHGSVQTIAVTASGYTVVAQQTSRASTPASVVTGYRVLGAPTVQNFTGSLGAAMYWAAGVATFRAA